MPKRRPLLDARRGRAIIEDWRLDYSKLQQHRFLGSLTPEEFARSLETILLLQLPVALLRTAVTTDRSGGAKSTLDWVTNATSDVLKLRPRLRIQRSTAIDSGGERAGFHAQHSRRYRDTARFQHVIGIIAH